MIINICPELKKTETCFVVEKYDQGKYVRLEHFHIPNNRLSEEKRVSCLRTIVALHLRDQGYSAEYLANKLAPKRKRSASTRNEFTIIVDNQVAGSYRQYCGLDTVGWTERSFGVADSNDTLERSSDAN